MMKKYFLFLCAFFCVSLIFAENVLSDETYSNCKSLGKETIYLENLWETKLEKTSCEVFSLLDSDGFCIAFKYRTENYQLYFLNKSDFIEESRKYLDDFAQKKMQKNAKDARAKVKTSKACLEWGKKEDNGKALIEINYGYKFFLQNPYFAIKLNSNQNILKEESDERSFESPDFFIFMLPSQVSKILDLIK